jgi:hypothetical protein
LALQSGSNTSPVWVSATTTPSRGHAPPPKYLPSLLTALP